MLTAGMGWQPGCSAALPTTATAAPSMAACRWKGGATARASAASSTTWRWAQPGWALTRVYRISHALHSAGWEASPRVQRIRHGPRSTGWEVS